VTGAASSAGTVANKEKAHAVQRVALFVPHVTAVRVSPSCTLADLEGVLYRTALHASRPSLIASALHGLGCLGLAAGSLQVCMRRPVFMEHAHPVKHARTLFLLHLICLLCPQTLLHTVLTLLALQRGLDSAAAAQEGGTAGGDRNPPPWLARAAPPALSPAAASGAEEAARLLLAHPSEASCRLLPNCNNNASLK
jgi:hypothetical protein